MDEVNKEELQGEYLIGYMDLKSLYPNLHKDHTIEVVYEVFETSKVDIDGMDSEEIAFYIAVTMIQEELNEAGLTDHCLRRNTTRGRKPKITGVGNLNEKYKRYAPYSMK